MEKLEIGLVALMIITAILMYLSSPKTKTHVKTQNKKKPKLLRFQRGNKTLTKEQQKQLIKISEQNHFILKQMWKEKNL